MLNYQKFNAKYEAIASTLSNNLPLILENYTSLGKGSYKLYVSHSGGYSSGEHYNSSVLEMTNNRLRVIPGTIRPITDVSNTSMLSMIAVANTKTQDYTEETTKGFKLITANVFQDDNDNIWELITSGSGGKTLVQKSADNLDEILKSRLTKAVTAHTNRINKINYKDLDYVAFYSNDNRKVMCGFIFEMNGEPTVFERTTQTLARINEDVIMEVADGNSILTEMGEKIEETAGITSSNVNTYVDYMRKLYGGTAYFDKFQDLIHHRLGMGKNGDWFETIHER